MNKSTNVLLSTALLATFATSSYAQKLDDIKCPNQGQIYKLLKDAYNNHEDGYPGANLIIEFRQKRITIDKLVWVAYGTYIPMNNSFKLDNIKFLGSELQGHNRKVCKYKIYESSPSGLDLIAGASK